MAYMLLGMLIGIVTPIDYSNSILLGVPQLLLLLLLFLLFIIIKNNIYMLAALPLMTRLALIAIPYIKYRILLDPNPDGYYHAWFTAAIIRDGHVPAMSTYSGMPFAHLMSATMAEVLGVNPILGIYMVNIIISLTIFLGYLIILKKYMRAAKTAYILAVLLLLSLPYEGFIAFYFRPKTYALTLIIYIFYFIFIKKYNLITGSYTSNSIILIILFVSTLFINISYAILLVSVIVIYYILNKIFKENHSRSEHFLKTIISLFIMISMIKLVYDYIFYKIILKIQNLLIGGKITSLPTVAETLPIKYKILGIIIVYGRIIIPTTVLLFIFLILIMIRNAPFTRTLNRFILSLFIIIFIYSPIILIVSKNISDALRALYFALAFTTPILLLLLFENKSKIISSLIFVGVILISVIYIPTTYSVGYINPKIQVDDYAIPLVEWSYSDSSQRISSLLFLSKNLNYESREIRVLADRNTLLMFLKYSPKIFTSGLVYHNVTLLLESVNIKSNYIVVIHLDKKAGVYEEGVLYRIPEKYEARLAWLTARISLIYNTGLVYQLVNTTKNGYYS